MKTFYLIFLIVLPVIIGGQGQTTPKDSIAVEVKELNKKLNAASQKLDLANKILDEEKVEVAKSKNQRTITRTITRRIYVPKYEYIYDTIYLRDTITIYKVPPTYGGDSTQKANWKQDPNEGKIFRQIFRKRK